MVYLLCFYGVSATNKSVLRAQIEYKPRYKPMQNTVMTASEHVTSKDLAAKYNIRPDQMSRKLKPLREALGVTSITVKIEPPNEKAYYIVNPELLPTIEVFLSTGELPVRSRVVPISASTVEHKEVSIVLRDEMHIDTANQTTVDKVRSALALRRSEVEKPVPVMPVFNGQADTLMNKALILNESVNAYQQHIEDSETALQERRESVQDASELIQLNIDRIGELKDRESKMIQVGLELSQAEQEEMTRLEGELKKLLADTSGQGA